MNGRNGESGTGEKIQIIVALISLVGVVLTAALGNWDRLFPPPGAANDVSRSAPALFVPAAMVPPAGEIAAVAEAQRRALEGSAGALNAVADQIAAAGGVEGAARVDRPAKSH